MFRLNFVPIRSDPRIIFLSGNQPLGAKLGHNTIKDLVVSMIHNTANSITVILNSFEEKKGNHLIIVVTTNKQLAYMKSSVITCKLVKHIKTPTGVKES